MFGLDLGNDSPFFNLFGSNRNCDERPCRLQSRVIEKQVDSTDEFRCLWHNGKLEPIFWKILYLFGQIGYAGFGLCDIQLMLGQVSSTAHAMRCAKQTVFEFQQRI